LLVISTFALLYLCGTRVTIIALVAVGLLFLLQTYRLSMTLNYWNRSSQYPAPLPPSDCWSSAPEQPANPPP
jgi:hypothetical protein